MTLHATGAQSSLRIDRLLWMLRLAHSRGAAQDIVAAGHIRRNGQRVTRMAQPVCAGDVLTVPVGRAIRVIALDSLPSRRGPASEAQSHYHDLANHTQQNPSA
ncbi:MULTISPECIES: RNA-binding S4 domain-containing protein [unclassified Croceicoccus]|jgi:ribosome-associated heat shock protein Hsp15|uniref:RNA-binding S4 domain-containing protein n=1 Tax=unclassified Croceicoccus TaxID=2629967 RepID=UPI001E374914|nr:MULTISPECIES: S4 domain-containing protein [unclassified Croceicoccus]